MAATGNAQPATRSPRPRSQSDNYTHLLVSDELIFAARTWAHGEHHGFTVVHKFMRIDSHPEVGSEAVAEMIAKGELEVLSGLRDDAV